MKKGGKTSQEQFSQFYARGRSTNQGVTGRKKSFGSVVYYIKLQKFEKVDQVHLKGRCMIRQTGSRICQLISSSPQTRKSVNDTKHMYQNVRSRHGELREEATSFSTVFNQTRKEPKLRHQYCAKKNRRLQNLCKRLSKTYLLVAILQRLMA